MVEPPVPPELEPMVEPPAPAAVDELLEPVEVAMEPPMPPELELPPSGAMMVHTPLRQYPVSH
jgi:hypothetical protein